MNSQHCTWFSTVRSHQYCNGQQVVGMDDLECVLEKSANSNPQQQAQQHTVSCVSDIGLVARAQLVQFYCDSADLNLASTLHFLTGSRFKIYNLDQSSDLIKLSKN
ncbi:hypothetical protein RRG08_044639 [Elysia crispata]|uniref:Uncharacterized protein n=1 Tax=Elysia crispata TaxID=231223 RepID=A0AAE0YM25_9GAST|nr:hypothetical protein RRG08_044639 [Elysia crispata]